MIDTPKILKELQAVLDKHGVVIAFESPDDKRNDLLAAKQAIDEFAKDVAEGLQRIVAAMTTSIDSETATTNVDKGGSDD